jgi:hypothetical protein
VDDDTGDFYWVAVEEVEDDKQLEVSTLCIATESYAMEQES